MHARRLARRSEVDPLQPSVCVRRAQHGGVQHPRQLQVAGVPGLAAGALQAVHARRGPADDLERPGGPLFERVFLDDEPDLLDAALDFLLGADQSRQCRIASSIFG